ncbi:MAG: UDP-N-acetylmuramoyl-L-alanine--D-glutamate ligase [Bacteriovoracaceae bacterium]|nr:UDP-N-acetylmuramoyl-L-alanine--D-glutamate ligase [Bacteriovoracaceae bacterium]
MGEKSTIVFGMGRSGVSALKLLKYLNIPTIAVNSSDVEKWATPLIKENSNLQFSEQDILDNSVLGSCEELVLSPGIPRTNKLVQYFLKNNKNVISEIELGYRNFKGRILGITGTNGKTTTVSLLGNILREANVKTFVGGNIGIPFCEGALSQLNGKTFDCALLELSSFQLESMKEFHPEISAILNISPSHMERYENFELYKKAKFHIVDNMTVEDTLFIPVDLSGEVSNVSCRVSKVEPTKTIPVNLLKSFQLPGAHNLINLNFAVQMARAYGLSDDEMIPGISLFKGVEHRLEKVDCTQKVFNDSKSTNWTSTEVALESFEKDVHLIMGGKLRSSKISIPIKLKTLINDKVSKVWLYGESAVLVEKELSGINSEIVKYLDDFFPEILDESKEGVLLFSPAFPSFDQFENFENRGESFKKLVLSTKTRAD